MVARPGNAAQSASNAARNTLPRQTSDARWQQSAKKSFQGPLRSSYFRDFVVHCQWLCLRPAMMLRDVGALVCLKIVCGSGGARDGHTSKRAEAGRDRSKPGPI